MRIEFNDVVLECDLDEDFLVESVLESEDFGKAIQEVVDNELDYAQLAREVENEMDCVTSDDLDRKLNALEDSILHETEKVIQALMDRVAVLERPSVLSRFGTALKNNLKKVVFWG